MLRSALRGLFFGLLAVYAGWNAWWLAQLQVPPSLFQALTGWPCPTTGCTRSVVALARGDVFASLRWNALTLPLCALALCSAFHLTRQAVRRGCLSLPPNLAWLWVALLFAAWILKLAGDPSYW